MGEFRTIEQVLNEVERHSSKIPGPRYDSHGQELFSSKLRRAVHAYGLTQEAEKLDPELKRTRLARMAENEAKEIEAVKAKAEDDYWHEMPRALKAMGLLEQELHKLAQLEDWPAVLDVRRWLEGTKLFLTLGGLTGTGKTIAAASALMGMFEWVECASYAGKQWRPRWGRFVKAQEIARLSYFEKNDRLFLDRLESSRLLILDDLGTETKFDTFQATLTDLIDSRARHERRTIITTNLASAGLKERYGARVWRRISEFGSFAAPPKPALEPA